MTSLKERGHTENSPTLLCVVRFFEVVRTISSGMDHASFQNGVSHKGHGTELGPTVFLSLTSVSSSPCVGFVSGSLSHIPSSIECKCHFRRSDRAEWLRDCARFANTEDIPRQSPPEYMGCVEPSDE